MTFEDEKKTKLGELVTDAYKALGLSRQKLAPMVGVSDRTLYAIEKGTAIPRAQTQRKLEEALGWRKGAIADVLGLGPDADLRHVTLKFMQPNDGAWGEYPGEDPRGDQGGDPMQQLQGAMVNIAILLRDKDREIEKLRQEVQQLRNDRGAR